jgi:beta-glucosidase
LDFCSVLNSLQNILFILVQLDQTRASVSNLFPDDFMWGTATAAYQIEGAAAQDGRQPSVWDTFSATPGRVLNRDTGAIACDHYHRYESDIKLMARLGVKHYRFSIAWPRIIPKGRGAVNEAGVDFYRRLVDCLQAHGITPHATLFHWDTPQALETQYGSWQNRQIVQDFADYATAVVSRLGDRITHWMTMNEIWCFTHLSYGVDQPNHAPGKRVRNAKAVWQTSHHALLAHGMACQAIRAASPSSCSVALVDNCFVTIPISESPANIAAAQLAFPACGTNGGIIYPALTGAYSPVLLEQLGKNAPDIQAGDLETIHQPLDGLGLNFYTGTYVRSIDCSPGYEFLPIPKGYPRLHMPWLHLMPECIYWGVRHISEVLDRPDLPVWITENGCAADDEVTAQGEVIDSDRILYLRQHFHSAHRAVAEGYPLRGYFVWSLLDNFEWAWGYDRRFGLVYIDYPTQTRIPKASFDWYAECIRQNRVV